MKELNEETKFQVSIKTLIAIAVGIFTLVGFWFAWVGFSFPLVCFAFVLLREVAWVGFSLDWEG